MSEAAWIALFAAMPPTLAALATLIVAYTGLRKLRIEVNGHTNRVMSAMKAVGHAEGKADTVLELVKPAPTTVIADRRHPPDRE